MSHDERMRNENFKTNSLLPSINYKHIITLVILLLVTQTPSSSSSSSPYDCPSGCQCNVADFSARCENLDSLIRSYSSKDNKNHHNHEQAALANSNWMPIKSLDLSNNQLTKISNQLELLVNLTELNLSHNRLTQVSKLNFEHLEKLDLSYNRITSGKLSKVPKNVVHLNLMHNEITYLPVDFMKLKKLRSLELNGNPLNCTCDTLMVRNWIGLQSVWSSNAIKCTSPQNVKGQPWLQARQNDICIEQLSTTTSSSGKYKWDDFDANDVMMGDQPANDVDNDDDNERDVDYDDDVDGKKDDDDENNDENDDENDDGKDIFANDDKKEDEKPETTTDDENDDEHDELVDDFIPLAVPVIHVDHASHESSSVEPEHSSQAESIAQVKGNDNYDEEDGSGHESSIPPENIQATEEEDEASGSGDDGIIPIIISHEQEKSSTEEPTEIESEAPIVEHEKPDLGMGIYQEDNKEESTEAPQVHKSNVDPPPRNTDDAELVPGVVPGEAVSSGVINTATTEDNTGTYVLLAIIGMLLVGLIIFVAIKNRKEKQQNRRNYDVEKNGATELQDMDKRLLGKPIEKNGNGKHAENSPLINDFSEPKDTQPFRGPKITIDEPVQELPLQQKSQQSLYENMPNGNGNLVEPVHGNGSAPKQVDSDEEVFHPATDGPIDSLNVSPEPPKRYSPIFSPTSPKSARYSPVYDEAGRVKIKLTETPKPKTPVIVTRSRSRAGDYVNTIN